jgi:Ca2+-binding EF-hand superfamily protein
LPRVECFETTKKGPIMVRLFQCVLIAGAVVGGTAAFADGDRKGSRFDFTAIDTNSDGEITRAEITAHRDARFTSTDTNKDGALSRAEFEAMAAKRGRSASERRINRMFSRLDENNDDLIQKAEMPSRNLDRLFERLDADKSGTISAAEAEKMRRGRRG